MLYDLHIHSWYSDGTWSPEQIAALCKQKQIGCFSITDHNLLSAYPDAMQAAQKYGLQCIPGVEIDCILDGKSYHVLGYQVNIFHNGLRKLLEDARLVLDQMSDRLIAAIEQQDPQFPVSTSDYLSYQNDPSRGGWKGLNYLIDRGLASDFDEVMALYTRYHVTYEKSSFPSMQDTCRTIREAGGYAILAHPGNYFALDDKLEENLAKTVCAGVQGVECYYPAHSPEYRKRCVDFCQQHQLFITCGGDCHGTFQEEIDGIFYRIGEASVEDPRLYLWK